MTISMVQETQTVYPLGGLVSGTEGGSYFQTVVQRDPVAYWRFGQPGMAYELMNGHHGIFQSAFVAGTGLVLPQVVAAPSLFDGDPDPSYLLSQGTTIAVPWGSWMDLTEFTFEGVFEITGTNVRTTSPVTRASLEKFGWGILIDPTGLRLNSGGSDSEYVSLPNGEYHYAVVAGGDTMDLWLNASLATSVPYDPNDNTGAQFVFGAPLPQFSAEGFPGRLDEYVYYDYRLTPADILQDYLEWTNGQKIDIPRVDAVESARPLSPRYGYAQTYRSLVTDQGAWAYWAHGAGALGVDTGARSHDATVTSPSVWEPFLGQTQPGVEAPLLLQNSSGLVSVDDFASSDCTLSAWVAVSPGSASLTTVIPLVCMAASQGASTFDKCLYLDTAGKLCWLTGTGGGLEVITDTTAFPQDGVARHVVVSVGPAGTKLRVSGVTKATGANTSSYASSQKIFYFTGGTGGGRDFNVNGSALRSAWVQATVFDAQLSDTQTDQHRRLGRSVRNTEYFWGIDSTSEVSLYGVHGLQMSGRTEHFTASSSILTSDPSLKSGTLTAPLYSAPSSGATWVLLGGVGQGTTEIRHVYWNPTSLTGSQVIFSLFQYNQQFITSPASVTAVFFAWRVVSIDGALTFICQNTGNLTIERDRFTHTVPLVEGVTNSIGFEISAASVDLWVNGTKQSFTRADSGGWSMFTGGNQIATYEFGGTVTPGPLPGVITSVMTGQVSEYLYNGGTGTGQQGGGSPYNKPDLFFEDLARGASEQGLTIDSTVETETVFELGVGLDPVNQSLAIDMVDETDLVWSFHQFPDEIQTLVETSTLYAFAIPVTVTVQGVGEIVLVDEDITSIDADLGLRILDPEVVRAPTSITVTVSGGVPQVDVTFDIDGTVVYTVSLDSDGMLGPTSIAVSTALGGPGLHVLTVTQVTSGGTIDDSETFTVLRAPSSTPAVAGVDAPPVEVPEALAYENGNPVRHWVFQDLLAEAEGGIGSYVFPHNPRHMTSPHLEHALTVRHSTASDGKNHVFQAGNTPKEWQFSGYCPSQYQQEQMLAYRHLNRRLYVIDHRNRAWKVVITDAQFIPRLRQSYNGIPTDWGSEYTITAVVIDQEPQTPEEV